MIRTNVAFSFLYFLCCLASSIAFVFEDCGSEVGKFNEISISSCDTSEEKCSIIRGSETRVSLKFTPSLDISNVKARAYGVLLDVPVEFPMDKPDVCKDPDSGVNCPLTKDQENEYKSSFTVDKKIPALSLDVMWEFVNENDKTIICVKFPVKIK
ncbi:protein NPC2 homolog [Pseudomyrmex gracilis]|uniref:protein NPC2 homolog n=1 Tax=Pseudomyrmex gracilis TaxID=219809 RepID=UPI0009955CA5|nr:protein NPC2 homolog [Pseudomyrmex gracilis]